MFGNKNAGSKAHTGSGNTGEALEKYQKIYGEMGHMMETIGFDTQQLSWLAKKNKEAFATLVTKNHKIAEFSNENLTKVEEVENGIRQVSSSSEEINSSITKVEAEADKTLDQVNGGRNTVMETYEILKELYKDKELYETIANEGTILSKRLKEVRNYRKGGNTGFETCITRLQMQSYVCIADFVYMKDKYGRPYGWGIAEYATPETLFGYDFITSAYQRDPQESRERILRHLQSLLPISDGKQIEKIVKG